jgi:hypothetical protein
MALVVERRRRNGQHRLYVKDTDTRAQLGYYDCRTGRLSVQDDARSYEIVSVLRPYLAGAVPEGLQHLMPSGRPSAEEMLAGTEDFETFSAHARRPRPRGFPRVAWPRGGKAERVVGRRLASLARDGWDVLHAVTPDGSSSAGRAAARDPQVGHLVVGPPGVFAVTTLHTPGARVRVGSHVVWVGDGLREYLRNARTEANSVARRLERALGSPVRVRPVLAFVGAAAIDTHDGHPDVLVVAAQALDRELRDCRGELSLPERDRIVAAAHRTESWSA